MKKAIQGPRKGGAFRVCVKTPCFELAVLWKGTDLSVPKKGEKGGKGL